MHNFLVILQKKFILFHPFITLFFTQLKRIKCKKGNHNQNVKWSFEVGHQHNQEKEKKKKGSFHKKKKRKEKKLNTSMSKESSTSNPMSRIE